jgi:hypothetical protein
MNPLNSLIRRVSCFGLFIRCHGKEKQAPASPALRLLLPSQRASAFISKILPNSPTILFFLFRFSFLFSICVHRSLAQLCLSLFSHLSISKFESHSQHSFYQKDDTNLFIRHNRRDRCHLPKHSRHWCLFLPGLLFYRSILLRRCDCIF